MKVLVDTSIWSLALRRRPADLSATENIRVAVLRDLIDDHRALIIGPIRQEVLSGIREREQFDLLRRWLSAFPDEPLDPTYYEHAAALDNRCRKHGVVGTSVDLLICSAAIQLGVPLLTADRDHIRFAQVLPLTLLDEGL